MTPFKAKNRVTSAYGYREYYNSGKLIKEYHKGLDIVPTAFAGEKVAADAWQVREVTGGKVIRVSSDQWRGKYVDVQTAPNTFERYQHMASICVTVGQSVPQGTVLGVAGATGNVTGAHLHFGVYINGSAEGNAVAPQLWCGIPNIASTYPGNDVLDNPPAAEKMYTVTSGKLSAGDKVSVEGYIRALGVDCTVTEL